MTMRITMNQARMGESGSLLTAGSTNTVSYAFGAAMVGAGYATDTDGVLSPPLIGGKQGMQYDPATQSAGSGDRILPVLHFKPTTGTTRRTSTNTATDTVEQVLDTYIIPAGAVGINDAVETHFIGKTNTSIVAANFTLRMNGVSILATTGNASNAIN